MYCFKRSGLPAMLHPIRLRPHGDQVSWGAAKATGPVLRAPAGPATVEPPRSDPAISVIFDDDHDPKRLPQVPKRAPRPPAGGPTISGAPGSLSQKVLDICYEGRHFCGKVIYATLKSCESGVDSSES